MWKLSLSKTVRTAFLFCAATAIPSSAQTQTFTTLASFSGPNGSGPNSALVQGTDGNFYGTTEFGGANKCTIGSATVGCGTVFKITPGGTLTTLHSFDGTDGYNPFGALLQATDGNFYGTTTGGGANNNCIAGCGTVYKITPQGTLTTVHSFNSTDGDNPIAGLLQATDGNFYGTTIGGGANLGGTVFKITASGTLTTLHNFCAQTNCTDGSSPSGLVQATDGSFYGTTNQGGANGYGTVFKITSGGTLTMLYSFCAQTNCTDGNAPLAGLVQGSDGNFYGTTLGGHGTVFKITSGGTLTTLYSFCAQTNCTDGGRPQTGLVQATDGNFYGTTTSGGANGYGTVFKITSGGTLTTLYSFCAQTNCTDGDHTGGLVQATNGIFYGTTFLGGNLTCSASGCGTVFSLSVGLSPFVETIPTSGAAGTAVIILGSNLTGTTGVSFNGTPATFTVVSSSEIQTTVPVGATTGIVQVTTPIGTLNSNVPFQVTKTRKRLVQVTSE